tara:strand:- start:3010 stop:3972 length:963 start_codon:yes stop_codon:yes gene_type:complete
MRLPLSFSLFLVLACGGRDETPPPRPPVVEETAGETLDLPDPVDFAARHPSFERYWYQGAAELSRFRLEQQRYGAPREGHAVLVFVTEPFLPDAQVKHELDDGQADVGVLKLNAYRRFDTGIYPYTVMTSVFGQVEERGAALKATSTVTEWCGQAFTQLNRRRGDDADEWALALRSYFQAEGDQDRRVSGAMLEDGLFVRGRFGAEQLPTGELELIPALHYLRFRHQELRPYRATARVERAREEAFSDAELTRYEVSYPELGRTLTVYFEPAFPFDVRGWEERQAGEEGVTRAVRTHAILTDYWAHNGPDDGAYRDALGL